MSKINMQLISINHKLYLITCKLYSVTHGVTASIDYPKMKLLLYKDYTF